MIYCIRNTSAYDLSVSILLRQAYVYFLKNIIPQKKFARTLVEEVNFPIKSYFRQRSNQKENSSPTSST